MILFPAWTIEGCIFWVPTSIVNFLNNNPEEVGTLGHLLAAAKSLTRIALLP